MNKKTPVDLAPVQAIGPKPDQATVDDHENEKKFLETERMWSEIDDLNQDRTQRKEYSGRLFGLIIIWLIVSGGIVLLQVLALFTVGDVYASLCKRGAYTPFTAQRRSRALF